MNPLMSSLFLTLLLFGIVGSFYLKPNAEAIGPRRGFSMRWHDGEGGEVWGYKAEGDGDPQTRESADEEVSAPEIESTVSRGMHLILRGARWVLWYVFYDLPTRVGYYISVNLEWIPWYCRILDIGDDRFIEDNIQRNKILSYVTDPFGYRVLPAKDRALYTEGMNVERWEREFYAHDGYSPFQKYREPTRLIYRLFKMCIQTLFLWEMLCITLFATVVFAGYRNYEFADTFFSTPEFQEYVEKEYPQYALTGSSGSLYATKEGHKLIGCLLAIEEDGKPLLDMVIPKTLPEIPQYTLPLVVPGANLLEEDPYALFILSYLAPVITKKEAFAYRRAKITEEKDALSRKTVRVALNQHVIPLSRTSDDENAEEKQAEVKEEEKEDPPLPPFSDLFASLCTQAGIGAANISQPTAQALANYLHIRICYITPTAKQIIKPFRNYEKRLYHCVKNFLDGVKERERRQAGEQKPPPQEQELEEKVYQYYIIDHLDKLILMLPDYLLRALQGGMRECFHNLERKYKEQTQSKLIALEKKLIETLKQNREEITPLGERNVSPEVFIQWFNKSILINKERFSAISPLLFNAKFDIAQNVKNALKNMMLANYNMEEIAKNNIMALCNNDKTAQGLLSSLNKDTLPLFQQKFAESLLERGEYSQFKKMVESFADEVGKWKEDTFEGKLAFLLRNKEIPVFAKVQHMIDYMPLKDFPTLQRQVLASFVEVPATKSPLQIHIKNMLNLTEQDGNKILEKILKKEVNRKADNVALVLNMLWNIEYKWTEIPRLFAILDIYLTAAGEQGILALERLLQLQKGDTKEAYQKIWKQAGLRRLYMRDSVNLKHAFATQEENQEQLTFAAALGKLFKNSLHNMQHFLAYYSPFYYLSYFLPFGQGKVDIVTFFKATGFYQKVSNTLTGFSDSMPQGASGDLLFIIGSALTLTLFLYFFIDYISYVSTFLTLGLQHIYTHVSNIVSWLFENQGTQKTAATQKKGKGYYSIEILAINVVIIIFSPWLLNSNTVQFASLRFIGKLITPYYILFSLKVATAKFTWLEEMPEDSRNYLLFVISCYIFSALVYYQHLSLFKSILLNLCFVWITGGRDPLLLQKEDPEFLYKIFSPLRTIREIKSVNHAIFAKVWAVIIFYMWLGSMRYLYSPSYSISKNNLFFTPHNYELEGRWF